ncbi:MAG: TRAM domain-containing protein [Pleurocapsa minor GSE-CHR-MK-17-07R]|jgi:23S rRNA (uracil1939-C5)-methyltransferase|nr:TRAM domain-containing protein [Pleurocapsa minor GSE-CHR-MK 17-07R]
MSKKTPGKPKKPAKAPARGPMHQHVAREVADVTIDDIAGGGSGIARWRNKTILVPFTIPGERVQVRLLGEQDGMMRAEPVRLIEASADRVTPQCEGHFTASCVRCGWQHIAYQAQLTLKQDLLADHLLRIGRVPENALTLLPTVAAAQPWQYLHHVTWNVSEIGSLKLQGKGKAPVRHRDCALIHPDLLAAVDALDVEEGALAGISHIRVLRGSDGAVMLLLLATQEEAPDLNLELDVSINMVLPDNSPMNLVGSTITSIMLGERELRATAGTYFRPNLPMLATQSELVRQTLDLKPTDRVLDLYGGIGTFSMAIAPHVSRLTYVDSYPPAVTDADDNLEAFSHVDVIEGSVEEVLPELDDTYDAAVVDPAHGLSADVMEGLARLKVGRLVYVSGDASELARDVKELSRFGYVLEHAQAVDMMPNTAFVDSVALFLRI